LHEGDSELLMKKLDSMEIDVAFLDPLYTPMEEYDFYPMIYDSLYLLLSASHPLVKKECVSLPELSSEKFLVVTGLKKEFIKTAVWPVSSLELLWTAARLLPSNALWKKGWE
jgi:DNA-binding transcriptional LysR family regulator